ncbi:XKR4 [Branchiostoma lanceolatum]|uniref:XK-related protein n=1 Tax=Branchiostoma lanceolatum TaxID=7740 RepID=A0A8K0EJ29_BRALA|nr:XKR4 [Branchiostoma lanceolatum]
MASLKDEISFVLPSFFNKKSRPAGRKQDKDVEKDAGVYQGSTFTIFDALFIIVSMSTFLVDIVTDAMVSVQYFRAGNRVEWGSLTLTFIIVPSLVMQVFSTRWFMADDNMGGWVSWLIHCLQMGPIYRYVQALQTGWEARKTNHPIDFERLYQQQSDVCMLRLFESFMESAPQLILQLYIMLKMGDANFLTGTSACVSLISLSWAIAAYSKAMRQVRKDKKKITWGGLFLQTVWRIGMVSSRVLALAMFTSVYKEWICVVIGVHWLLMTVWVYLQKTDFCDTWWEERLFNAVVGVIYCFCFFNIKEGRTRRHIVGFYTIMLLENSALMGAWYPFRKLSVWYNIPVMMAVWGGFLIGAIAMTMYYNYCHPNRDGNIPGCPSPGQYIKAAFGFHRAQSDDTQQDITDINMEELDDIEILPRSRPPSCPPSRTPSVQVKAPGTPGIVAGAPSVLEGSLATPDLHSSLLKAVMSVLDVSTTERLPPAKSCPDIYSEQQCLSESSSKLQDDTSSSQEGLHAGVRFSGKGTCNPSFAKSEEVLSEWGKTRDSSPPRIIITPCSPTDSSNKGRKDPRVVVHKMDFKDNNRDGRQGVRMGTAATYLKKPLMGRKEISIESRLGKNNAYGTVTKSPNDIIPYSGKVGESPGLRKREGRSPAHVPVMVRLGMGSPRIEKRGQGVVKETWEEIHLTPKAGSGKAKKALEFAEGSACSSASNTAQKQRTIKGIIKPITVANNSLPSEKQNDLKKILFSESKDEKMHSEKWQLNIAMKNKSDKAQKDGADNHENSEHAKDIDLPSTEIPCKVDEFLSVTGRTTGTSKSSNSDDGNKVGTSQVKKYSPQKKNPKEGNKENHPPSTPRTTAILNTIQNPTVDASGINMEAKKTKDNGATVPTVTTSDTKIEKKLPVDSEKVFPKLRDSPSLSRKSLSKIPSNAVSAKVTQFCTMTPPDSPVNPSPIPKKLDTNCKVYTPKKEKGRKSLANIPKNTVAEKLNKFGASEKDDRNQTLTSTKVGQAEIKPELAAVSQKADDKPTVPVGLKGLKPVRKSLANIPRNAVGRRVSKFDSKV